MTRDRVTKIKVLGETWHVPRGFGRAYARAAKADLARARAGKPGDVIHVVIDFLALVGYAASIEQVADWDLRRRVEAVIYASIEHARASDDPIPRHPRLSWLPKAPWQGPPVDVSRSGALEGPSGTPIPTEAP